MCGIVGMVGRRASSKKPSATLDRMLLAVRHRGPDATGVWCEDQIELGHARLSIIDLSDAANQPMVDDSGRYVLVYNGEVYNYRELRKELEAAGYHFRTASDTEVVLQAFRAWGSSCVSRFNGMWAFAIWDRRQHRLFAARDRAGKKPFYYAHDRDGTFYFASEVKALIAAGLRFHVNPQAAFDFLTQGTYGHLGAGCFFGGLSQLPAAHSLTLSPGETPEATRYWDIPAVASGDRLAYDAGFRQRFRSLLIDAVQLRLRSDVPVGATLSGGIDSSTLVGIIDFVTEGAPLPLFTAQFPNTGYDETTYVEAVVSRLRRPELHKVSTKVTEIRDDLECVLAHQEEPFGDTSILAHFQLMRAARENRVPVILSGQGSDELLMGYPSMVQAYLGYLISRGQLYPAFREARLWARGAGVAPSRVGLAALFHALPLRVRDRTRAVLYVGARSRLASPALRRAVTYLRYQDSENRSQLESYFAQVFERFSIPHLVHYDDRNAMASAIEGRMPFLDHRLVELLFSVRYEALFSDGFTKRALRESFVDLLPTSVRLRRDKIGFYTPLASWLRCEVTWIRDVLSRDRVEAAGLVKWEHCRDSISQLQAGSDTCVLDVWRSFILHLWLERFDVGGLSTHQSA